MDQDRPDLKEIEEDKGLPDRGVKEDLMEDRVHEDRQGHEDRTVELEYPDQLEREVSADFVALYSPFQKPQHVNGLNFCSLSQKSSMAQLQSPKNLSSKLWAMSSAYFA